MGYNYLMNMATGLYFICYIPELYANYHNKNANIYNVPEKVAIFVGTSFALAYSVLNSDTAIIINYAPLMCLDTIAMLMRIYYVYKNNARVVEHVPIPTLPRECRDDTRGSERSL
jgi:uncharacterized protein with PQ loop repeat